MGLEVRQTTKMCKKYLCGERKREKNNKYIEKCILVYYIILYTETKCTPPMSALFPVEENLIAIIGKRIHSG